jgi:CDP-diacylglycerol--glycerol-3-phosphate 3-phosphatidyltransferase
MAIERWEQVAPGAAPVSGGTFARDLVSPPNLVTLSRIALFGVSVALFFAGHIVVGVIVGAIGGATDYVDGWLARKTGRVTRLGEILDQFSDVLLELGYLLLAAFAQLGVPPWVPALYMLREVWVGGLRRWVAGAGANIPSTLVGKLKSAFVGWPCVPIFLAPVAAEAGAPRLALVLRRIGQGAIAIGLVFIVLSAVAYTRRFIEVYNRIAAGRATRDGA